MYLLVDNFTPLSHSFIEIHIYNVYLIHPGNTHIDLKLFEQIWVGFFISQDYVGLILKHFTQP